MTVTRKSLRATSLLLISMALLFSSTACTSEPNAQQATQERLKLGGSTTVEPAALAAAQAFMIQFPNVEITVRGGGSSIGVKGITYEAFQIGMTSRPLKESELTAHPNLTETVIGRDGVSVVVNQVIYKAGVTELTLEQVAAIWRGEITNWQEIGGPDLAIIAYDKELGRGTRDTFAKIVLGGENEPAPGTVGALGENETVVSVVSDEPGAISILSTGWQTDDVVGLSIIGQDGLAIPPTNENVASGRYPILRNLNLVTNGPPQGLAAQFIDYILSPEGQVFVEAAGYSSISQ